MSRVCADQGRVAAALLDAEKAKVEAESLLDGLRRENAGLNACLDTSARRTDSLQASLDTERAQQREVRAQASALRAALGDLCAASKAGVDPFSGGEGETAGLLQWATSACDAVRRGEGRRNEDCALATADLVLSCVRHVGVGSPGMLVPFQGKAPRYRDLRGHLREMKADSGAFLTVWAAHGKAYLSAVTDARRAAEAGAAMPRPESVIVGSDPPSEV